MRELVSALRAADPPPVIIIQADEGPFPAREPGSWRDASEDEIEIKTSILNAYYFPDGDYRMLHQDVTPVNSFRIIFNKYFGMSFASLPDKTYGSPNTGDVYEFFDVTEMARRPWRQ